MKLRVWIFMVIVSCGLFGCSSSFKANWYFAKAENSTESEMYLAILNNSSQVQTIEKVWINPVNGDGNTGYLLKVEKGTVDPGQLLIMKAKDFNHSKDKDWQCRVPVEVVINPGESLISKWFPDRADLLGRMPNSLPLNWWHECTTPTDKRTKI